MRLALSGILSIYILVASSLPVFAQGATSLNDQITEKRPPGAKRNPKTPTKKNDDADAFEKYLDAVEAALDALPESFKKCLKACKLKIVVTDFTPNGVEPADGAPRTPPGELEGTTYSVIKGIYLKDSNKLILAQKYKDNKGISHPTENPALVTRHEAGHAIDHCAKDFSNSKEFKDAFNKDTEGYVPKAGDAGLARNFQSDTGPAEAFADCFALSQAPGDPKRDDFIKRRFPSALELVKKKFKECPDAEKPITDGPTGGGGGGEKTKTLKDCYHSELPGSKPVSMRVELSGDGVNTSHAELVLTNPKTGATTSAELATMCISTKTQKPPVPREIARAGGVQYTLAAAAPPNIVAIVKAAKRLSQSKKYDFVPLAGPRRLPVIGQLAVWKTMGRNAGDINHVTKSEMKRDILSQAHIDQKSLRAEEEKALEKRVDAIFDAVDLTLKEADHPRTDEPKHSPDDPQTPPPDGPGTPKKPDEPGSPLTHWPGRPDNPETPGVPGNPDHQPVNPGTPVIGVIPPGKVLVPEYTVFHPNDSKYQDMMTTADGYIDCPDEISNGDGDNGGGGGVVPGGGNDGQTGGTVDGGGDGQTPPAPKTPPSKTYTGSQGETVTEDYFPDGKIKTITKVYPPTKGGDPKDPTSETVKTETKEYKPGEKRQVAQITVKTEVRVTQDLEGVPKPKKITTRTRDFSDPKPGTPSYVEKDETETVEIIEIDENGLPRTRRTTKTTTFSGPDDKKGTTTEKREVEDKNGKYVPEKPDTSKPADAPQPSDTPAPAPAKPPIPNDEKVEE